MLISISLKIYKNDTKKMSTEKRRKYLKIFIFLMRPKMALFFKVSFKFGVFLDQHYSFAEFWYQR